jgi:hypothetical protein
MINCTIAWKTEGEKYCQRGLSVGVRSFKLNDGLRRSEEREWDKWCIVDTVGGVKNVKGEELRGKKI